MTPVPVDTVVAGGLVVTVDDEDHRYDPGSVAIDGSTIVGVGDAADISQRFRPRTVVDAAGKLVVPGFVNTHTHLFQTMLKGVGSDLPLHEWIKQVPGASIVRMEERDHYLAALVGCLGALRSGTTTLLDYMYPNPRHEMADATLQAIWDTGIRALLGRGVADVADPRGYPITAYHPALVEPVDAALADCERLHRLCATQAEGRVTLCLAPPNMRVLSTAALEAVRDFSAEHGTVVSMHVAESPRDDEVIGERHGCSGVAWLDKLDLLGDHFVAVHCVRLQDAAIRTFAERGVSVSYNPVSNMYIGNGIAPVRALRDAGVRVTFGTDGAAVNTNDLLETLKVGSLLDRLAALDPSAMTAEQALRTATIEGARAVGLGELVGSLEVGKRADLVVADLRNVRSAPFADAVGSLVFSSNSEVVDTVMVDGRTLVRGGAPTQVDDEAGLLDEAQRRARDLVGASGR